MLSKKTSAVIITKKASNNILGKKVGYQVHKPNGNHDSIIPKPIMKSNLER